MQRNSKWLAGIVLVLILVLPGAGWAQVERLVLGKGGLAWGSVAEMSSGLEDTTAAGSLQPRELDPEENILRGPRGEKGEFTNVFGKQWAIDQVPTGMLNFELGVSPRIYARFRPIAPNIMDGDSTVSVGVHIDIYSIDLALPLPVNRVVFYPPIKGRAPALGSGNIKSVTGRQDIIPLVPGELLKDQFPQGYEISAALEPQEHHLFGSYVWGPYEILLAKTLYNTEQITNVSFPTQVVRFLRCFYPLGGILSELEVYGEGFPAATQYRSQVIDMGKPVNFGRILWGFTSYRKEGIDAEAQLAPDAPVSLSVETRSGTDDTPLAYHVVTEIGKEREVSQTEWARARQSTNPGPGDKGSVTEDAAHWSFWSSPYHTSGPQLRSPDGRQYFQVRFFMESTDIFAYGRLDSIAIEYAPLLADRVVGEVALRDQPHPARGMVEVPIGEDAIFTYDVQTAFSSSAQAGFDAIRLTMPSAFDFLGMEVGESLLPVNPDSVRHGERELVVYFPSNRITQADNQPIRFTFRAAVFDFSTSFLGEVFEMGGEKLPQSIDPGDANPAVSTDDIQVFAPIAKLGVLSPLSATPSVVTPNGDGSNDRTAFSFTLLGIETGEVEMEVYDLGGNKVRTLVSEPRGKGRHTIQWEGEGEGGSVVLPGIYLARVSVDTDIGTFVRMRSIAVVY